MILGKKLNLPLLWKFTFLSHSVLPSERRPWNERKKNDFFFNEFTKRFYITVDPGIRK